MTYDPDGDASPFDNGKTEEQMSAEMVQGWAMFTRWLKVFGRYLIAIVAIALILYFAWPIVRGVLMPLLAIAGGVYLVWRFRDAPIMLALRIWFSEAYERVFPPRIEEHNAALPFHPLMTPPEPDTQLPHIEWNGPPQDEDHGWMRTEYQRMSALVDGLPRGHSADERNEAGKSYMYIAELLRGLHHRGDDPLLRGAERVVEYRSAPAAPQPFLAAAIGGSLLRSASVYIMGGLALTAAASGAWGLVNHARIERMHGQLADAQEIIITARAANLSLRQQLTKERNAHAADAMSFAYAQQQSASLLTRMQTRTIANQRREEARNEAASRGASGAFVDFTASLQQLESDSAAAPGDDDAPAAAPSSGL